MDARSTNQPGTVTFSIFDPSSEISFLLPIQTSANSSCSGASCGRMNLQNPNSLDTLVFNGDTNYVSNQNTVGAGNWRSDAVQNNALGYVLPVTPPTIPNNQPRDPVPFHQHAQNILGDLMAAGSGNASTVKVTMLTGTQPGSEVTKLNPSSFQSFASRADIPQPSAGMVNVIVQVVMNGSPVNFATSSPSSGFVFRLPEVLTPRYTAIAQKLATDGMPNNLQLGAVQADGRPLPAWLKFNPETKTFTADRIPEGTPDMQLKIQTIQNGRVIEEIIVTIDLPS
jgi:hypothetical protein